MSRARAAYEIGVVVAIGGAILATAEWLRLPDHFAAVAGSLLAAPRFLRNHQESWGDLGLRSPASAFRIALWSLGGWFSIGVFIGSTQPLLSQVLGQDLVATEFHQGLAGNPQRLLLMLLATSWTTAAFDEELLFRGFLLQRLRGYFAGPEVPPAQSTIQKAVKSRPPVARWWHFGAITSRRGMAFVSSGAGIGGLLGSIYWLSGRNLWVVILAHGLVDTISIVALNLGAPLPSSS